MNDKLIKSTKRMGNALRSETPTDRSVNDGQDWMLWLTLIIIGIIVVFMVYFYFQPTSKMKGGQALPNTDEFIFLNRIEDTILAWITLSALFITLSIVIKGFESNSIYYSIIFLLIGIISLIMANINYLEDRKRIIQARLLVPSKLDVLFMIVIVGIVVSILILYDIIRYQLPKGPSSWTKYPVNR